MSKGTKRHELRAGSTRNIVESAINLAKADRTSRWEDLAKEMPRNSCTEKKPVETEQPAEGE